MDKIFPTAADIARASSAVIPIPTVFPSLLQRMADKLSKQIRGRLSSFSSIFPPSVPCIEAHSAAMALFLTPKRSTADESKPDFARFPRVTANVCFECSKSCTKLFCPVTKSNKVTRDDLSARSKSPILLTGSGSTMFSYKSKAAWLTVFD